MPDLTTPLLLEPVLKERVWGGRRLGGGIGEAWDLSVYPGSACRLLVDGEPAGELDTLVRAHPDAFGGPVQLLAKRLDCEKTLSVQVHPKVGEPKTEAWVVLDAAPEAGVYLGFQEPVDADRVRRAARDGSLPDLLHFQPVAAGDVVFVPSGTVHAIGAGLFLFEIQQSSDTTYRLFDWGRDRPLHLEAGVACSDLGPADPTPPPSILPDGSQRLLNCEHFYTDRVAGESPIRLDPGGCWVAATMLEGSAAVGSIPLRAGQTVLVPRSAGAQEFAPQGPCRALRYGPGATETL